ENPEDLIRNKRQLLIETRDYEHYVVSHFHPYFKPLKPLMRKWFNLLRFAHRQPAFEVIHDWTLRILDETIDGLPASHESDETSAEVRRRENDLRSLQYFPESTTSPCGAKDPKSPGLWDMSPAANLEVGGSGSFDGRARRDEPSSPNTRASK